ENDYVDPEELAEAKIQEMRKVAAAIIEDMTRQEVEAEAAQKLAEVQAQVEQAQAEAERAQAEAEQAQAEAEQAQAQAEQAQAEAEQAQAEAEQAQAEAERAQAEAEQAQAQLALTLKNALKRGKLTVEEIAEDFGVSVAYVKSLQDK
ncbi:MAG: hypothetical protein SF053_05090, partial [Bacteroidia bacterium]|nr:hypothetical protein [Bacteroidia bacterium]